jgi:hypothetical protein
MRIIGLLLVLLGIAALCIHSVTFFTHDRVADVGFFAIDVHKPHTIFINPIAGIVAVVAGLVLVASSRRSAA